MSNFQKLSLGVSRQAPIQGTDIASGSATAGQILTADGSGNSAFVMPSSTSAIAPTIQIFLSGSGTYTTPAGVLYIEVEMVGGGGGGSWGGAPGGTPGGTGGTTTFGVTLLTAIGGTGGNGATAGGGGSASIGTGSNGVTFQGTNGQNLNEQATASVWGTGGSGGNSPFGGAGTNGGPGQVGGSAATNSGSGGGGGAASPTASNYNGGGGGGSGGYLKAIINNPATTYPFAIGGGGTAGAGGDYAGGAGGSGIIIVMEYYSSGGSFSNPMTTTGDLIYGSTTGSPSVPDRLGIGTTGQVLTVMDGLPAWGAGSSPATFGSRSSPLAIVAADGLVGGTNVSTTALVQVSFIQGSSGPTTITASPAIAAGTIVGQELQIIVPSPTTAANTVTIPNQSAAVELNGDWTGGPGDMLTLIWDSTAWVEKCRNN